MRKRDSNPYFTINENGNTYEIGIQGQWTITHIGKIEKLLKTLGKINKDQRVLFHCNGLENIDTSGAWMLYKKYQHFINQGGNADFKGFQEKHFRIVKTILEAPKEKCPPTPFGINIKEAFIWLGQRGFTLCSHIVDALEFLGHLSMTMFRLVLNPRRLHFASVVRHIHETGLNAIPIVAVIVFMFSAVLSFQGAMQLRIFGAEVYMVNLTSLSVLREVGVMMTAIIVAGRTGSAFAAEIGVMKLREEIDALETMGADIYERLIVPRVLGLIIALPLLTIIANLIGLFGGGLVAYTVIDMPASIYIERVAESVTIGTFWVGMIKAPVFAFLIATASTFRGLQVSGAADSIGRYTTLAVVQSIFLVILADAVFTIIFQCLGL